MSQLADVLGDLRRRMGIAEAAAPSQAPLNLDIEGAGRASFEEDADGERLLATLSWPLEPWDRSTLAKAFEACSPGKSPDFAFGVGLSGDKILLMAASPLSGLDAPAVENLILRLVKIRQSLAGS